MNFLNLSIYTYICIYKSFMKYAQSLKYLFKELINDITYSLMWYM